MELWVIFPIPPVWGQSASCGRSYAHFTEEWTVCLARGNCRGDEGLSIDITAFVSIDCDARIWAEHILWPLKPRRNPKLPEYPWTTKNLIYVIYKSLLTATRSLSFILLFFLVRREGRNSIKVLLELHWFWFYIIYAFLLFIYDLCDKRHVWIDPPVRFRVQIGYLGLAQNIELLSCNNQHRIVLTASVLESWTRTLILESLGTIANAWSFLLTKFYWARIARNIRELI